MSTVSIQGADAWRSLVGRSISFDWSDGWEDYWPDGVLESVQEYDDEGFLRLGLQLSNGAIYSVFDNRLVEVTVHD